MNRDDRSDGVVVLEQLLEHVGELVRNVVMDDHGAIGEEFAQLSGPWSRRNS